MGGGIARNRGGGGGATVSSERGTRHKRELGGFLDAAWARGSAWARLRLTSGMAMSKMVVGAGVEDDGNATVFLWGRPKGEWGEKDEGSVEHVVTRSGWREIHRGGRDEDGWTRGRGYCAVGFRALEEARRRAKQRGGGGKEKDVLRSAYKGLEVVSSHGKCDDWGAVLRKKQTRRGL